MIEYSFSENGLSLLLPQYSNSDNIKALIQSLLSPMDSTVDVVNNLSLAMDLRTATKGELDNIGKLLNVYREGREDESYRSAIKAQIFINNANGKANNLLSLTRLLVGDDVRFSAVEQFPASFQLLFYDNQDVITEDLISKVSPIGVRGIFLGNPYAGKEVFQLSTVDNSGTITGGTVMPDVDELSTANVVMIDVIFQ